MVRLSSYFTHRRVGEIPEHFRRCWWTWYSDAGVGTEETDDGSHVLITIPTCLSLPPPRPQQHDDWWPSPHLILIMVVTRKPPLPPTPSSRSSSSQTIPRLARTKGNHLNQPEHSSPLANGKSKTADPMVSSCSYVYFTRQFLWMNVHCVR